MDISVNVGDWVVLGELSKSKGEIAKILSIGDGSIYSNYVGLIGTHALCHSFEECIDDILPLPLTEEMMELNHWDMSTESDYRTQYEYYFNDFIINLRFSKIGNGIFLTIYDKGNAKVQMHIEYVSELQNALRLCRLQQIASNFKVTKHDN